MVTTVTTATISTVTTIALSSGLSVIAVITLLFLVGQREFAGAASGTAALALRRILSLAIVPLLMVFILIAARKLGLA